MASDAGADGKSNGRDEHGLTPAQRTWLEHIRQSETEGLTFAAYCSREGLPVSGLYSARRKLRGKGSVAERRARSASPPRLAAVRLAHPVEPASADIVLANGVRMSVTVATVEDLAHLAVALAQLAR